MRHNIFDIIFLLSADFICMYVNILYLFEKTFLLFIPPQNY